MARWHRRMTILRFHTPLIEPDRRISRIRLSDKACVMAIFPLRRQRRLVHGGAGRVSGVSQPVSGVNRLAAISRLSSPQTHELALSTDAQMTIRWLDQGPLEVNRSGQIFFSTTRPPS